MVYGINHYSDKERRKFRRDNHFSKDVRNKQKKIKNVSCDNKDKYPLRIENFDD